MATHSLLECFNSPNILVVVGGERTEHWIPKALLFHYSKVCKERAETSSDGGSIQVVELPECDGEDFEMVLRWIYTGRVLPAGSVNNHVAAYIRFFQIAELLELLGPFDGVERGLELALIRSFGTETTTATASKDHIATIVDASTKPIHKSVLDLLARPLAAHYLEISLNSEKSFPSELRSLKEPLLLEVLKIVNTSLKTISLTKPDSDGETHISILCPLRQVDLHIKNRQRLEIPIKFQPQSFFPLRLAAEGVNSCEHQSKAKSTCIC